ncbi:ankyrin repeat domain-containing protein [Wolbachia endosymbiont (group A) of Longitarsus flavicornis]|uniref:ankyrin repeat domain-containing protein n=1 Tax=Wolbachia endosymbiont (group A) of Longitarsus flavicornis TaxID=3066134 RepID=UPI0030CA3C4D
MGKFHWSTLLNAVSQNHKNTPLHVAIGEIDVINALLDKGAKVNAVNKLGDTPLHIAVKDGNVNLVKALLDKGANFLLKNKDGKTPKDLAIDDRIKKLLKESTSATQKGIYAGSATALLGTAAAALAVGGVTYMMLKPSTEMDEVKEEQGITGDERKV